jgi:hypothetical protein
MSRSPTTYSAGTAIPRPWKGASRSLLRSMFRYQLKAPVKACSPCRAKSSAYAWMSCSVSQAGRAGDSGIVSRRPRPSGMTSGRGSRPSGLSPEAADQEAAEGVRDVLGELGVGDSRLLEVDLVEALAVQGAGDRGPDHPAGQDRRNAEPGHPRGPCPGAASPRSRQRVHPSRDPRRPPAPLPAPRSARSRRRRGGAVCTTRRPAAARCRRSRAGQAQRPGTRPPPAPRTGDARSTSSPASRAAAGPAAPAPARRGAARPRSRPRSGG